MCAKFGLLLSCIIVFVKVAQDNVYALPMQILPYKSYKLA